MRIFDDIVHNTLGTLIGVTVIIIIDWLMNNLWLVRFG